jgi:hypothetical protein
VVDWKQEIRNRKQCLTAGWQWDCSVPSTIYGVLTTIYLAWVVCMNLLQGAGSIIVIIRPASAHPGIKSSTPYTSLALSALLDSHHSCSEYLAARPTATDIGSLPIAWAELAADYLLVAA